MVEGSDPSRFLPHGKLGFPGMGLEWFLVGGVSRLDPSEGWLSWEECVRLNTLRLRSLLLRGEWRRAMPVIRTLQVDGIDVDDLWRKWSE